MYDRPEDWDEWIEDLVMEADGGDDDDDFSEDDDEATTPRQQRRAARQRARQARQGPRPARRPDPRGRYGSEVKGQDQFHIDTPAGKAKVELPESMVTVQEAQGAFDTIAQDMKAQADGLRELMEQRQRDVVCLAAMIRKTDRKLTRSLKRTELAGILSASAPLLVRLLQQRITPAPAPLPPPEQPLAL